MFKIENDVIHMTRGDKGVIELNIDGYTFNTGDKVEFRVYEKRGLDKLPVLSKEVVVTEESSFVTIELTSEDTKIGNFENKQKEYWYEIELNNNQTVIGYGENGPKILNLYPEGAEKDDIK